MTAMDVHIHSRGHLNDFWIAGEVIFHYKVSLFIKVEQQLCLKDAVAVVILLVAL